MALGVIQQLEGCKTTALFRAEMVGKEIFIPLTEWKDTKVKLVRIKKQPYDLAVVRLNDASFVAFQLRCTHADNELFFNGNLFNCPQHGSNFNVETGVPVKGPAEKSLYRFPTHISGNDLVVEFS